MRTTIVGRLASNEGDTCHKYLVQGRDRPELRQRFSAFPAAEYRSTQPDYIPLELEHERTIGSVLHLERDEGGLWCVAVVDRPDLIPDDARYLSPSTEYRPVADSWVATDIELVSVSLTDNPASYSAMPVATLIGDLPAACRGAWRLRNPHRAGLLERAKASKSGTTVVHDRRPAPEPIRTVDGDVVPDRRSSGRWIEQRDGWLVWEDRHIPAVHR